MSSSASWEGGWEKKWCTGAHQPVIPRLTAPSPPNRWLFNTLQPLFCLFFFFLQPAISADSRGVKATFSVWPSASTHLQHGCGRPLNPPQKCHSTCGPTGLTCLIPRSPKGFRITFLLNESKCYRANKSAQSDCEAIKVWVNVTRPVLPQWRCACKPTSEEPLTEMSDWPTRSEASVHRKLSLYAAAEPAHVWVSVCWSAERHCCGFGRSEPTHWGRARSCTSIFFLR